MLGGIQQLRGQEGGRGGQQKGQRSQYINVEVLLKSGYYSREGLL